MDNRLKFLYRDITELWGHVWRAQAGNGKPGASEVGVVLARGDSGALYLQSAKAGVLPNGGASFCEAALYKWR